MRLKKAAGSSEGPNLTPVIDVVFLLLIFFLVATRLDQEEREIDTRLPVVVEARPAATGQKQIIVNVDHAGVYRIETKKFTAPQVRELLRLESEKNAGMQKVLIRADQRTQFKFVARIMGLCEKYKIKHTCAMQMAK